MGVQVHAQEVCLCAVEEEASWAGDLGAFAGGGEGLRV